MSNLKGNIKRHRFHGAIDRFEVTAEFIYTTFGNKIRYIADVAGGQGMLSRILNKRYNYESEVIDPRGYTLKGITSIKNYLNNDIAKNYDLIVGLHPDQATRAVGQAALVKPTILIPCCNFWDTSKVLSYQNLIDSIEAFYKENSIKYSKTLLGFSSNKNTAFITYP